MRASRILAFVPARQWAAGCVTRCLTPHGVSRASIYVHACLAHLTPSPFPCRHRASVHHHVADKSLPATVTPIATVGTQVVSDLAVQLWPRYHFGAGQGVFFQRAPYSNPAPGGGPAKLHVTRFLGLGSVAKKSDKSTKWMHALNLAPLDSVRRSCAAPVLGAAPAASRGVVPCQLALAATLTSVAVRHGS